MMLFIRNFLILFHKINSYDNNNIPENIITIY